ncbi:trypsin-like peptidase domain-containing protein [Paenibacillus chondroitinus]|uniref:Trypsin-like peptidase domain-containing protein n=1 Tax=Paenibacillus chondroitinus TaxID=59842 RepID=A0ABU6DMX9_9BACL|nr:MULTISPECIES: trypsin-like peptidase domain-containing protein [Paenibacillus]MCY9661456.1 trypsin-like peptidase domain-containing protein [Paenibacillus anseongense]MEB4798682.1 trypsin-like peptidase domain-containing protein [Paenibacillus chondroitinus]
MGNWNTVAKKGATALLAAFLLVSLQGPSPSYAAEINAEVPKVIEKASPSVVAIIGKPSYDSDKTLEKNRFNLAHGTGVIVESNGVIVTNAHVVKDMKNIVVVTSDGTTYNGHATNIDEESDLALVKIDATGLTPATFASSSDIKVGETVAAIGTPISFALRNSVTVGIVSGLDRSVSSQYQLIQTDAAINPGNSGGALINMNGEVIGINTMKYADFGVENLGFAIPVDTVKYVLKHFQLYGKVKRPYLGLELEESWEAVVGLPSSTGLRVAYVDPDSPAAAAGIEQDDLVVSIGANKVKTLVDYNEAIKKYLPDEKVDITIQSEGASVTKSVTLGEVLHPETKWKEDAEGSDLDADRGKTKIGDSHFGWSMKYPAGLVKGHQSEEGDSVSFVDAKGEFSLSIQVDNESDELSPSALLNKLTGSEDDDYSGIAASTILERQYVKREGGPFAKIVGRSGDDGYIQTRGYLHQGRLYKVQLFVTKDHYNNDFKQNSYNDLLDSFKLSFNAQDESLKDISVYSNGNTTYTNEYGLSFALPSSWQKSSYTGNSSFFNSDYSQSLQVEVTSASSGDTLAAWADRERKQLEAQYVQKYRKISAPEELTLAGVPALKTAHAETLGNKWTAGYSLFFIKDKYKYEVEVSYPQEEEGAEINDLLHTLTTTIEVDKDNMDQELGFIQDLDELMDPNRTITYKNEKYKYTLQIPEKWTSSKSYDNKDQASKSFLFTGGYLTINADAVTSYEDAVKEEDASQKKSHDSDSEYAYTDEESTVLGGVKAKKYEVNYVSAKVPYKETTYIFSQNQMTYTVTLRMDEAVRTEANEARLKKAFDSLKFLDAVNK